MIKLVSIFISFIIVIISIFGHKYYYNFSFKSDLNESCLMLHGGGFSGFWYSFNKLKKKNPTNNLIKKKTYCYSAGCLAFIAYQTRLSFEEVLKECKILQYYYINNRLSMKEIRKLFILNLLNNLPDGIDFSNLIIITFKNMNKCLFNKISDKDQLLNLLLDTTTIPFVTDFSLNFQNLDGGFCLPTIPYCNESISLPFNYFFLINIFNPLINNKTINDLINYE